MYDLTIKNTMEKGRKGNRREGDLRYTQDRRTEETEKEKRKKKVNEGEKRTRWSRQRRREVKSFLPS